jgi:S-adenosylmethionine synthetase
VKAKRCKTLHKDEGKSLLSSLAINNTQQLLPLVIHSSKKLDKRALDKLDSKKTRLLKVQGEMKKHMPSFFK